MRALEGATHQHAVAVGPGTAVDHLVLGGAALLFMVNAVLVFFLLRKAAVRGEQSDPEEKSKTTC